MHRRFLGPGGPNPDVRLSITVSAGAVSVTYHGANVRIVASGTRTRDGLVPSSTIRMVRHLADPELEGLDPWLESQLLPSMYAEVMAIGARHSSTHAETYERTIRLRL